MFDWGYLELVMWQVYLDRLGEVEEKRVARPVRRKSPSTPPRGKIGQPRRGPAAGCLDELRC